MRTTGLSEFIEPCGTIAMPASRSSRIASSDSEDNGCVVKPHLAAIDASGRLDQAQDGQRHGRLAGARFAGQAEAFVRAQA